MKAKTLTSVLYLLIAALVLATAALGAYAGRLRWQNSFLRAELARTERQQIAGASATPPAPAPAPQPATSAERALSSDQRSAMLEKLKAESGAQKDVWFATAANDREASAYERALRSVFEEAGWKVRRSGNADFSLRPGVFFLMADASPAPYVLTALAAFQAAEITVSSGRDYRAFNDRKKRDDPAWRGFEMDSDQHYIVAIGPAPKS